MVAWPARHTADGDIRQKAARLQQANTTGEKHRLRAAGGDNAHLKRSRSQADERDWSTTRPELR